MTSRLINAEEMRNRECPGPDFTFNHYLATYICELLNHNLLSYHLKKPILKKFTRKHQKSTYFCMRNSLMFYSLMYSRILYNRVITIQNTGPTEKNSQLFKWEVHHNIISGIIKYNYVPDVAV